MRRCRLGPTGDRSWLTPDGRRAIVEAAPGHVDLVRHLFFGGLPKELLAPLSQALEAIYDHIIENGTLPSRGAEQ